MPTQRLSRFLHRSIAWIENHRLARPWRHRFAEHSLWKFTRMSVSRGVAIGLFFGVMTPVAQIVFATIAAILIRANLIVAAASTMITNPFTMPFVYYAAFRIGVFITGPSRELMEDLEVSEEAARRALEVESWYETLASWFSSVGYPLLVGMFAMAVTLAVSGYVIAQASWALFGRRGQ